MIYTDPTSAAPAFAAALSQANRILLLSHINPDGDAIGSLLGLWHALRAVGKEAVALASSELPSYATGLPGIEHVQVYRRGDPLPPSDLIWMVDTAQLTRVGAIAEEHLAELHARPMLIVDHHVTNEGEGRINLIAPESSSTADLLYRLLRAMALPVSAAVATCLLMGIMTDTQSFQTSSTNPRSLRVTAELLEAGADHQAVVRDVYYAHPFATLQLIGLALATVRRDGELAWVHISHTMMEQTGAEDEASDDIIRLMQRVAGVRICALFKERRDGTVKISLRSTPGINVAAVARIWGGGGHTQAAGATLRMSPSEAEAAVLPRLRAALAQQERGQALEGGPILP